MSPDLIIVGAGTAGCIMADQLRRRSRMRICVIEPASMSAPAIDRTRPSRWLKLLGSVDDWSLATEPSPALAKRCLVWPRGRGIGGSGRINAMIWFPPTLRDFQTWADASTGCYPVERWRREFEKVEQLIRPEEPRWISDASGRFLQAAEGLPDAEPMQYRRINRSGQRLDWQSLLGDVDVVRATVDRVCWDDGNRATGVVVINNGSPEMLESKHGVILCGGAIATPTILMRSGIGPRDELVRHGIDTRLDSDAVGRNLQDHLVMPVIYRTKNQRPFQLDPSVRDVARWQTMGVGTVASNIAECGGLFANETLQIHVTPTHYLTFPAPSDSSAMTLAVNLTQPQACGSVTLRSADATTPPVIAPNYLEHAEDMKKLIEAVKFVRILAGRSPLAEIIDQELLPGERRNDASTIAKSIARYSQTLYHPVGTCRFGDQIDSVVDTHFQVRGTEKLWAVDASVLPKLTIGNPSAAVMTWASLAAGMIFERISFS